MNCSKRHRCGWSPSGKVSRPTRHVNPFRTGSGWGLRALCFVLIMPLMAVLGQDDRGTIDLGTRRELFVDTHLLGDMRGDARLQLHRPSPREMALVHDAPWEGNTCGYHTVFQDGDVFRMYYRGSHFPANADTMTEDHPQLTCYAESSDGIHWEKPDLGLFEFNGSTENNIVWMGPGTHNFCPFKDSNPDCDPDAQYKALGVISGGLIPFKSADAIHWEVMQETPVITRGAFDSQNLAFWDPVRECYVDYHRGFHDGVRAVMTCTSDDFITWSDPVWLDYPEGTPREHLYTNQILAYFRAPHIKMGFPKRFVPNRTYPGNRMAGISDGVFMTSRDGLLFQRWAEAFVRPGLQRERWVNRNNMTAWGILQTKAARAGCPDELSLYSTEGYYHGDSSAIRRYTLRLDGFVSVSAPMTGGEIVTKTVTFALPEASAEAVPPGPVEKLVGPMVYERETPIHGEASLRFRQPSRFRIPETKSLGPEVTFAVTTRAVPDGHRRLFSAYNGGPIVEGGGEFILDAFVGQPSKEGDSLRFMYDGTRLSVSEENLPEWERMGSADAACHIAATWQDGVAKVYFNGALVGTAGQAGGGAMDLALGDVLFGEDYPPTSTSNEPFLGVADDILVLRRTLTDAEVMALAEQGVSALQTDTEAGVLYTMEGDQGTLLTDQLQADGAADAALSAVTGIEDGDCQLLINVATSAAGSVRVELQDDQGVPLPGFSLDDSDVIFGDSLERPVSWHGITELKQFADRPIRIRFELKDADLYALRFGKAPPSAP